MRESERTPNGHVIYEFETEREFLNRWNSEHKRLPDNHGLDWKKCKVIKYSFYKYTHTRSARQGDLIYPRDWIDHVRVWMHPRKAKRFSYQARRHSVFQRPTEKKPCNCEIKIPPRPIYWDYNRKVEKKPCTCAMTPTERHNYIVMQKRERRHDNKFMIRARRKFYAEKGLGRDRG